LKTYYLILSILILCSCKKERDINDSKYRNSNYIFYKENGQEGYWQKISKNSDFKYNKGTLNNYYDNGNKFGELVISDNFSNRIEKFFNKETSELTKTIFYKDNLEYKRVHENGYQKYYYSNKGLIINEEGLVKKNLEQGLWKRYWNVDGKLKEIINFKDGKPHGERKNYWKNGNLKSSAYWDSGIQSGKGFFYYENGNLEESNYWLNEKLHGVYKAYYPDKTLKTHCNYWNNQTLDTCRNYYPNGNLKKLELYKLDTISLESSGKALLYYESGKLQIETEVINYKPNGKAKYYNEQGKLIEIVTFENGVKIKSTLK
jgi:antitoxin component YwqK of YwqJK toxin-antitoxin module